MLDYPPPSETPESYSAPTEITDIKDIAEFVYLSREMNGVPTLRPKKDAAVPPDVQKEWTERMHYYIIRKNDQMIAGGCLKEAQDSGQPYGFLCNNFCIESERGHSFSADITAQRLKDAQEKYKYKGVSAHVLATNPIGLNAKLKLGFIATNIFFDQKICQKKYNIIKSFEKTDLFDAPSREGYKPVWEEINMGNTQEIQRMLGHGWVGVDMKNLGDKDDNNPKNWVLILEKNTVLH